jgi:small redox-active disulfide protein 2
VDIRVLGSGCANCRKLEALVEGAIAQLGLTAEITHVTDYAAILAYGVMSTPALVVDGEVKLSGRVPSLSEVVGVLRDASA